MKKNKKQLTSIIFAAIIILTLFTAFFTIIKTDFLEIFFSDSVHVKLDESVGMPAKDRKKEFNKLCKYIENNVPMLYEYEELYDVKYEDIKNYYKHLIENTESDYEYYVYLQGFFNNIPSGHMSIGYPNVNNISFMHSYFIMDNESFLSAQPYWENILREECQKHCSENENALVFAYNNGKYIGSSGSYYNDIYYVNNAELLSLNGISVDEFVKIFSSVNKLKYDHVHEKAFRDMIVFNDKFGEKCTVQYQLANGEIITNELYCGAIADVVLSYMDYFNTSDNDNNNDLQTDITEIDLRNVDFTSNIVNIGCITAIKDTERNMLVVNVPSFDLDSKYAAEIITNASNGLDNIIIDIRENRGGYAAFSEKLLSAITEKNINIDNNIYITKKRYESEPYFYKNINKNSGIRGLYSLSRSSEISGNAKEKKNYYLLISDNTLSAADAFASEFKKNNLGIIIGTNNTQGERYGSSYLQVLEYSGIYFYYTEYKYINTDGTDNSVYGTAPDIYVNENPNMFKIKQDIILSGGNAYDYKGHLQWDEALIKAIEIIKENENDQTNNPSNE